MRNAIGALLSALLLLSPRAEAETKEGARAPEAVKKEAPHADETLTLAPGETRELSHPGATRVAVGDPDTVDIKVGEGKVLHVQALQEGETTVLVWTGKERKAYRVVVQR